MDNTQPAFPVPIVHHENMGVVASDDRGMTLRQWYAGQALMGELACQKEGYEWGHNNKLAEKCFKVADTMIEADKK